MALFDNLFGAKDVANAAAQQRAYLAAQEAAARDAIQRGTNQAAGAVTAGTAAARPILQQGFDTARTDVGAGTNAALGNIDAGTAAATGKLDAARGEYDTLAGLGTKYGGATSLQLDALGVNGPEGVARAQAAFQTSPGYQFELNQGLDAINRRRNAAGMLASGNTDVDALIYAQGLARNEYNNWRNSLGAYLNPELAATSGTAAGRAGLYGREADLLFGAGKDKAGIESQRGAMLADLARAYGTQGAGLETGLGQNLANIYTGGATNQANTIVGLAQPYAQTYGNEAAAKVAQNANLWNLGMQAATLGAGFFKPPATLKLT